MRGEYSGRGVSSVRSLRGGELAFRGHVVERTAEGEATFTKDGVSWKGKFLRKSQHLHVLYTGVTFDSTAPALRKDREGLQFEGVFLGDKFVTKRVTFQNGDVWEGIFEGDMVRIQTLKIAVAGGQFIGAPKEEMHHIADKMEMKDLGTGKLTQEVVENGSVVGWEKVSVPRGLVGIKKIF